MKKPDGVKVYYLNDKAVVLDESSSREDLLRVCLTMFDEFEAIKVEEIKRTFETTPLNEPIFKENYFLRDSVVHKDIPKTSSTCTHLEGLALRSDAVLMSGQRRCNVCGLVYTLDSEQMSAILQGRVCECGGPPGHVHRGINCRYVT